MASPFLLAFLIPLLPLLAGIAIGLFGRVLGEQSSRVGVAAVVSAFVAAVWTLYETSLQAPRHVLIDLGAPISRDFFEFGLYLDRLSAAMMVVITGVSTVVHLYSVRYLQGDRGYARFFSLLGLITSVLLWLVCSPNLFMLFVFWQLLSWLLYLLLAYNYGHPPAYHNAFKTLLVHRIGDVAFLAGIALAFNLYGTLDFALLFARAAESSITLPLWPGGPPLVDAVTVLTLLIFIGAMAKSAQVPLHVWLPDTMDTPTPVSALMHAGIVNAGGFLLNRLAPLYGLSPTTLHVIFVIGGLTILLGATMMLIQSDIKKTLGFSTVGQMGYMIMECGLGAFALAIFHLIAHGIFKATLFLGAGHVIHAARRDPLLPPLFSREEHPPGSRLTWVTGVSMTLVLPLMILLAVHGFLAIPLRDQQGAVIFLFFAWVTASQALFSLYRLNAVATWTVEVGMIVVLLLIGLTYLWAAETFTYFLYPLPAEVAGYFQAAALPNWLFDALVIVTTVLIVGVWVLLYANARGRDVFVPDWASTTLRHIYLLALHRLYLDALYAKLGQGLIRVAQRVDRMI